MTILISQTLIFIIYNFTICNLDTTANDKLWYILKCNTFSWVSVMDINLIKFDPKSDSSMFDCMTWP